MRTTLICLSFMLAIGAACWAQEVKIPYSMVQKEIEQQMFIEGRSYLSGDATETCDYAYLENPRVYPQSGRLAIEATFKGKKGKEVLGKCVGVGKSFDIVVSGVPAYREGQLRFDDAFIQFKNSVADAVFGKLLDGFAESLEDSLKFPIKEDTQGFSDLLNQGHSGYEMKVEKFNISKIELLDTHIDLHLDTTITLKEK